MKRRLGILADTHDEIARTELAVKMMRDAGAEALIHCGDLASAPIVEICSQLPLSFVLGNHDADSAPELQRLLWTTAPSAWAGAV